jgi:hypothetical protein
LWVWCAHVTVQGVGIWDEEIGSRSRDEELPSDECCTCQWTGRRNSDICEVCGGISMGEGMSWSVKVLSSPRRTYNSPSIAVDGKYMHYR